MKNSLALFTVLSLCHCSLAVDNFDVVCTESTDGFAVYVPHPYDCSLFFECVGLKPVLFSCPDGLYFDPTLNVCNWPSMVDCQAKPETTSTGAVETTSSGAVETTSSGEVETLSTGAVETTSGGAVETTSAATVETSSAAAVDTTPGNEEKVCKEDINSVGKSKSFYVFLSENCKYPGVLLAGGRNDNMFLAEGFYNPSTDNFCHLPPLAIQREGSVTTGFTVCGGLDLSTFK